MKGKQMKKFLTVTLTILLILSLTSISAFASEAEDTALAEYGKKIFESKSF